MKTKLLSLFLAIVVGSAALYASDTQVNGIWYDFDSSTQTASVTYRGSSYLSYTNEYTGSVVIPSSVTYSGKTYSVTSIGEGAFYGCPDLTSITIPHSVISIGYGAFLGCTGLTSIEIPNSVTSIGNNAFSRCSGLNAVYIGDLPAWCNISFANSEANPLYSAKHLYLSETEITDLVIPSEVTEIKSCAFSGCSGLTSVIIPNSVTSIGGHVFYNCIGLTSVTIPNSVTSIGGWAFYHCSGLTSITIPNNVTSIGNKAFFGCTCLTSVTIPNSVTSIGNCAFSDCTGLISFNVEANNNYYCSIEGILFNKDRTELIQYPPAKRGSYTIPNSVTKIASGAFIACNNLTAITIPNTVTSMGAEAFFSCKGLTSIEIPNSIDTIKEYTFQSCTNLTSVIIPNSVTRIGNEAFSGCTGLKSIFNYATTPQKWLIYVFHLVDKNACILYVPDESIHLYKAADEWKDFGEILPLSAKEKDISDHTVEPTENTVEIAWPQVSGAYTYDLIIKDTDGNVVCTLTFNAQGQLISIAFNAPAHDGETRQAQSIGFAFTITGLQEGTTYNYSIVAKDESGNVLNEESGTFTTESSQGLDDVSSNPERATKLLRNNQILILRGDKTYTVTGQKVK